MTTTDLRNIIMDNGSRGDHGVFRIDGHKLLEHIEDIDWFVALLDKFMRSNYSFVDDYPYPIEFILNEHVSFGVSWGGFMNLHVDGVHGRWCYNVYEV